MLPFGMTVIGVTGAADAGLATAKDFTFGPFPLRNVDFVTLDGLTSDSDVVGLLGQNFLRLFDIEYDLGNGVIRLFKPLRGCDYATPVYWSPSAYSVVPVQQVSEIGR
jgi:hypothetical protein